LNTPGYIEAREKYLKIGTEQEWEKEWEYVTSHPEIVSKYGLDSFLLGDGTVESGSSNGAYAT
jgi:hypothetical protein